MSATLAPALRPNASTDSDHSRRALLMLWLGIGCFLLATAVGLGWDKRWHTTHVFNSFYSAPHLFIYTMLALTVLAVAGIALSPRTREEFGGAVLVRLPGLGWLVPGALALCGAGLGVVMLAGVFDDIWHSNFGLDETAWSLPHAMLGTGFQLTFIGLLACRLALGERRPVSGLGWGFLGTLLLMFSVERLTGPLSQASPDIVRGIAAFPVLAIQPPFQHTMRIYQDWNLNRTNWLFVPAAALATGMALSIVLGFARRAWVVLLAAGVVFLLAIPEALGVARYFGMQHDPRNWLPVPVLPAAVGFVIARKLGAGERASWLIGGAVFGIFTLAWTPQLVLVPTAAVLMLVGAGLGRRAWAVVQRPSGRSILVLTLLFGLGLPAATGVVDLYLRLHTP